MKGIIIDGVAASGKTSILRNLNKSLVEIKPTTTKFFISEHYTERMLEHLKESGGLTGLYINRHVDKIINILQQFQNMLSESKFSNDPRDADLLVILERFILTHLTSLDIENEYKNEIVESHFKALNSLGIKQVALVVPEEHLKERIMSTINYRNMAWKEYLFSKGDEAEILKYYSDWQNKFLRYLNKYKYIIDTMIIEIRDTDYQKYSDLIIKEYFN